MRLALLLATMLWAIAPPSDAAPARLHRVVDGDTLEVRRGGNLETVRIFGIDAPERGQPGGEAARAALSALVRSGDLEVVTMDRDRYGRTVARVASAGRDVGQAMIRAGQAWHYTRYDDSWALREAQRAARSDGLGIWADPRVQTPWRWRAGAELARSSPQPAACTPSPSCTTMTSCSEALAAFARCGPGRIDRDRDGIPCEALCLPTG